MSRWRTFGPPDASLQAQPSSSLPPSPSLRHHRPTEGRQQLQLQGEALQGRVAVKLTWQMALRACAMRSFPPCSGDRAMTETD